MAVCTLLIAPKPQIDLDGVDIKAVIGTKAIGTLQGISYQVSREKAPINF